MNYTWDSENTETYKNKVGYYKFNREFSFIVKNGKGHFNKILDIAGGSGRMSIPLLSYSNDITVTDINKYAIEILNDRNDSIKTILGDFIETDINDKYSLITCIEAIGHFQKDWDQFFTKIDKLLEHDGHFIFTHTNPDSWRLSLRKLISPNKKVEEKTLKELWQIVDRNNFEVIEKEGFNWMPLPLASNSILVPFFDKIERIFKLSKWISQSPWVLVVVKKKQN